MNDDLISRSKAIRWVKAECNPYGQPTLDYESGIKVIEHLERMTSAQPEQRWIPVTERLPEEHNSFFAKLYGTDKWNNHMFRKTSDEVIVTTVFEDGTKRTDTAYTHDGEWEFGIKAINRKVTAWMPLPEPYREEIIRMKDKAMMMFDHIRSSVDVDPWVIAELKKVLDAYLAYGCSGCAYESVEEWNMPCAKCKRNSKDYWRKNAERREE